MPSQSASWRRVSSAFSWRCLIIEPALFPEPVAFRLGVRQFLGGKLADLFAQESFQGVKALVHAVESSPRQVHVG